MDHKLSPRGSWTMDLKLNMTHPSHLSGLFPFLQEGFVRDANILWMNFSLTGILSHTNKLEWGAKCFTLLLGTYVILII